MVGKGIMEKTALLSVIGIIIAGLTVPSVAISEPENVAVPYKDTPEAEVILSTSFEEEWVLDEDNDYVAPPGWDVDGICKSHQRNVEWATHYWNDLRDDECFFHLSHSGSSSACVWWSDGYGEASDVGIRQDEWLITPEMDFSMYISVNLTFWSVYYWNSTCKNHDYVKVSTDGGETWETIADLVHDEEWWLGGEDEGWEEWNHYEHPIVIDLSKYAGEHSVKIAWNYNFTGEEGSRAIWVIDDVEIKGIPDTTPPSVSIEKPKNAIYVGGNALIPFPITIVIGKVNVTVNATDDGKVKQVEFLLNNETVHVDDTAPFTWTWDKIQFGIFKLKVIATDGAGNTASEEIPVLKLF